MSVISVAFHVVVALAGATIGGFASAEELRIPSQVRAEARIVRAEREGLWEKTLVVTFSETRRTLGTSDGVVEARAVVNHSAHPLLWRKLSAQFMNRDGRGGKAYTEYVFDQTATALGLGRGQLNAMSTAADADNVAVVTRTYGPLWVTVLATAGAKTNALRTGVDEGRYIEGQAQTAKPQGTINIVLLTNATLTDGAMARAIVTITEGKTAALQDLNVPSSYTAGAQATGTGTDSVVVVSGTGAPLATYTGGHSRIGELIGKATYEAVVESLGKQNGFFLPGVKRIDVSAAAPAKEEGALRVALLHLDPEPGAVARNRARVEAGVREAIAQGADWIVTPELAETGYGFAALIGSDWVSPFPDTWMSTLAAIARDNRVALFVGFVERDGRTGRLHNSVAVIDRSGIFQGAYRKHAIHGSAEAWSTPGSEAEPFVVDGIPVGILICADAYRPEIADRYKAQGARLLLSPANWAPIGGMAPDPFWAARTRETQLPLVANNRTGREPEIDFSQSASAVVVDGRPVLTFTAPTGRVFYVDWDRNGGFSAVPADAGARP